MSPRTQSRPERHPRHRNVTLVAAALTAVIVSALLAPAMASAVFAWYEGGSKPFGGTIDSNLNRVKPVGKYALTLNRVRVKVFTGIPPTLSPVSAQRVGANTLVADPNRGVLEYKPSGGAPVWKYDAASLVSPSYAQRFADGNTLIVDRGANKVFEVNDDNNPKIVWSYGGGTSGVGPGQLADPVFATRVGKDAKNILIVDANGGHRVILVRRSDHGIIWRYGKDGVAGTGADELERPVHAQRLSNNNTLITDQGGHRVIEVDGSGELVDQYGESGVPGTDSSHLKSPTSAIRQSDGSTLIVDSGNNRLWRIDSRGRWERIDTTKIGTTGALSSPQMLSVTSKGTILIADQGNGRLVEIGNATSGRYTTKKLNLGTAGVRKRISRIEALADLPTGTAVKIQYAVDGGSWRNAGGPAISFPSGLVASYVSVRAILSTTNRSLTPQLNSVQVTYDVIPVSSGTTGTGTNTWSNLYQQQLTYGPFQPGTTGTTSATKATGAAGALPQGAAVPGIAQSTVYSGFLMQRVSDGAAATKDSKGLSGLPVEAAGTAAALLLLASVYSLGLASTTLSTATQGAAEALKSILTRSM